MGCKYYKLELHTEGSIGGSFEQIPIPRCELMENQIRCIEISEHFRMKGMGSSFAGNYCPVAELGKWDDCPFRE
jgi:hypothetical protein